MSHSPPGYMDGVPVKISERFKPPPKIVLPQGVVNRLSQYDVGQVLRESCYGCELEDTVLKRMTEWRAITERERSERSSRLRVQEQNRLRHIEDEQNRKLHQISYPNTDELSSASDDNGDAEVPCRSARSANRGTEDDDEEEEEEENDESAPSGSSDERTANAKAFDHSSQFSSILVPTVIREVAPSAAQTQAYSAAPVGANITIPKTAQIGTELKTAPIATFGNNNNNNNNNYNKINYSDFENDTSSPFDNMELRTINDLDILAQVLKLNTNLTSPTVETEHQQTKEAETEILQQPPQQQHSQQQQHQPQQQLQQQQQQQHQQQHLAVHSNDQYTTPFTTNQQYSMPQPGYPLNQYQFTQTSVAVSGANDYLGTSYSNYHQQYSANYAAPYDSAAMATPGYSSATAADNRYRMNAYTSPTPYHVPVSQSHQPEYRPAAVQSYAYGYHYPSSVVPSTSMTGGSTGNTYATNYGYSTATNTTTTAGTAYMVPTYHGYQSSSSSSGCTPTNPSVYSTNVADANDGEASGAVGGLRSKSRSVPDILRQLNEEIQDSATRRTRNNSQTISDGRSTTTDSENSVSGEKRIDYTQYNQLSHAEQNLVKRISSMGFPLERVVWVLQRIGNDDKKVIEHLIPLSELLDVGFEEQKISDALLKFDNNKHKALDYLIS